MSPRVVCDASALVAVLVDAGSDGTSYDASYVAVAELAEAELITLDRRISRVPQLRIAVRTPELSG